MDVPMRSGTRVVAVAGIARPERFFTTLREQGYQVVRELRFPDHDRSSVDLDCIRAIARETSADFVVTTEKDGCNGWRLKPVGRFFR